MRNKDKSTFRKIEFHRKESFYLIVRGLEVGIASGLIAVLYRFLLSFAEKYLMKIIDFVKGNPGKVAVWFVILALIGFLVSMLVKWEVQGGGSGIPQVNGEIKGYINPSWWRVILVKLFGGTAPSAERDRAFNSAVWRQRVSQDLPKLIKLLNFV